jgi:hypothetical protein
MSQNGLNAALRPSATRRLCLSQWLVPDRLGRAQNGLSGVDRAKSIASWVQSKNVLPCVCDGTPSIRSTPSPNVSERPCCCGSNVTTT